MYRVSPKEGEHGVLQNGRRGLGQRMPSWDGGQREPTELSRQSGRSGRGNRSHNLRKDWSRDCNLPTSYCWDHYDQLISINTHQCQTSWVKRDFSAEIREGRKI